MKTSLKTIPLLASAALFALNSLSAVETNPVGYTSVPLVAGADNFVTLPLNKTPDLKALVDSTSVPGVDRLTLSLDGVSSLEVNGLVETHYVRFTSEDNSVNGKYFTVTSNTSGSVTIDTIGDDLSDVGQGDAIDVIEFWTLGALFPPATQTALVQSTGNLTFQRGSEVLLPNRTGDGINRAPSAKYYVTSTEWRDSSDFSTADDTPLPPDTFIIIRQDESAGVANFVVSGTVPMFDYATFIHETTQTQDNYVVHGRPTDLTLAELGLGEAFTDSLGNLTFQRKDELLVWENTTGINPAPNKKFYRVAGEWRDTADFSESNGYIIPSSAPIVIRKAASDSAGTVVWTNSPTY